MPGDPAQSPYNPERTDPPSIFKDTSSRTARWGDLPPKFREAVELSKNSIDDYPPEWRHKIAKFYESFQNTQK
jgi:hypothetical protein